MTERIKIVVDYSDTNQYSSGREEYAQAIQRGFQVFREKQIFDHVIYDLRRDQPAPAKEAKPYRTMLYVALIFGSATFHFGRYSSSHKDVDMIAGLLVAIVGVLLAIFAYRNK